MSLLSFLSILIMTLLQPAELWNSNGLNSLEPFEDNQLNEADFNVTIYPKISKLEIKELNVIWNEGNEEVTLMVTDIFDKVLYNRYTSVSGKASRLDVSNLDKGVYQLKIRKGNQQRVLKFVRIE